MSNLVVSPLSEIMGAEIENVDLSAPLPDAVFAQIAHAFLDHKLLVFRGQALSSGQIQAFAERFGPIEVHTVRRPDGGVLDGVHAVTNLDADGKPSQKPHINANYFWHSDKSHYPAPALLSMLYAVELPPDGGETEFANMAMAYADLPPVRKRRIEGLKVENDFEYAMTNVGKVLTEDERRATPPVVHPLVRTHPETGVRSLFVGMYSRAIVGMPEAQGRALIKELLDFATQPRFTFRHQWQLGDLVVWDNRCLNHRAVMNYEIKQYRRVLLRCVVRGTVPA
ncbi:MAG TPA: TauD/TfdA family dioxygenase [Bradyrhizobium sp.]|nr:TauD/TfdA family dioxygenase [Bradyrhizobium sp.]